MKVEVLAEFPRDPDAFTQGLEMHDGVLFESAGSRGGSSVRTVDYRTGEVLRKAGLVAPLRGSGITVVDDRIWQLTWQDGAAIRRDLTTLAEINRVAYTGEGWGLCHDGTRLVMSDGTAKLTFRDPVTFAVIGTVDVTRGGEPVEDVEELECVDGAVWANLWESAEIVRIDPASGEVTAGADLGSLRPRGSGDEILNGIAAVPGTGEFLVTGKNWHRTYRIRLTG